MGGINQTSDFFGGEDGEDDITLPTLLYCTLWQVKIDPENCLF